MRPRSISSAYATIRIDSSMRSDSVGGGAPRIMAATCADSITPSGIAGGIGQLSGAEPLAGAGKRTLSRMRFASLLGRCRPWEGLGGAPERDLGEYEVWILTCQIQAKFELR